MNFEIFEIFGPILANFLANVLANILANILALTFVKGSKNLPYSFKWYFLAYMWIWSKSLCPQVYIMPGPSKLEKVVDLGSCPLP